MTPDTIAAISTPPGRGGIGILRLSGPDALAIAAELVPTPHPPQHAHVRYGKLLDTTGTALDEALLTIFRAPHSYTGEDIAEIAAHGSPVVLAAALQAALAIGQRLGHAIRLAAPGEFTQRAFLAGRLDLTQAEAVADLIAAQTLDQARVAAQQLGGTLARQVAPAKGSLLHLIALLEAGMDFASGELDDVDVVPPSAIESALADTIEPLEALAATFRRGQLLRDGAAIALVGPPNAGKSSLFNRLLARDRAIVTATPGTTRDTLEETLSLNGIPLRLIDTAGLRDLHNSPNKAPETPNTPGAPFMPPHVGHERATDTLNPLDEAELQGIARTREALADADLILLIHDITQPLTPAEQALAATLADRPHLHIHNKLDLLPPTPNLSSRPDPKHAQPPTTVISTEVRALADAAERSPHPPPQPPGAPPVQPAPPPIQTSALTGHGLDTLRHAILTQLNATGSLADTAILNNLRQQQAIAATLTALAAAQQANRNHLPHEILLVDLHTALGALDSLTGTTTPDDILARIFATFCIGK